MLHVHSVVPSGAWSGEPADTVVLDYDERYRRRVAMTGVRGLGFLLDLPEAVMLRAGDGLKLEDGRIVEVVAAPESLIEIRAADAAALTRIAWHLGNRHLPTELMRKSLRIRRSLIEEMAAASAAQSSRSRRRSIRKAAPMSARRRMAMVTTTTTTTTMPITATRIIATAIIRASAPSRMSTAPAAVTTITTTLITVTIPIMATERQAGTGGNCRSFPASRPRFPWARSPIRTAWNGRSRRATLMMQARCANGSPTSPRLARCARTRSCSRPRIARWRPRIGAR